MRVRMLHSVAAAPDGLTVGQLAGLLAISQPTCSHHVRRLAEAGLVRVARQGRGSVVTANEGCRAALPLALDVVMGMLTALQRFPDPPPDVEVRAMRARDWPAVLRIYGEGIAAGNATFDTDVPRRDRLDERWLAGHRWIAVIDRTVAGWAAVSAVSGRDCYAGVAETSVYVGSAHRGRGVGKALLHRQVLAAEGGGLWTLQTSIFPENRASLALHRQFGFRTVGVRERIAQHRGRWRDTVLLERRRGSEETDGDRG
jgi:L-amino acid N-acyltransferase YncA